MVNFGNGASGGTFDAIDKALCRKGASLEFICVYHCANSSFPNGIPNPLLPENHSATADVVLNEGAEIGVAFIDDFDNFF